MENKTREKINNKLWSLIDASNQVPSKTKDFIDEFISELSNLETVVPDKVEEGLEFEIFTNWAAKKGYIFHAGMWFIGSEDDDATFLTSELFTLWKEEKK